MIDVAHVITGLGTGGAEGFLARLAPKLLDHDIRSRVYSLTSDGDHAASLREHGIDVLSLGLRTSRPDPRRLYTLRAHLADTRPHLVMTWLYHADLLGGLVARSCGIPVIWNIRQSAMGPEAPAVHHALVRVNARLSQRLPLEIICVSESAAADHAAAGYPGSRLRVIHNGFDVDRFRPDHVANVEVRAELNVPRDAPLIGHVARYDPQKDHATALAAFARVVRERPDAHLIMCGDGIVASNAALAEAVTRTGAANQVRLLGRRTDLPRIDAALDVALSSSAYGEGLTNALAEAMACDVPCVATASGDAQDLVGDTGLVVPPRDPEALGSALLRILGSNEANPSPRARILERWTLEAATQAYAQHIRDAVHRG